MNVLQAREQLEFITLLATGFGMMDKKTRDELIDNINEAAEIERQAIGIELSKLSLEQARSVFAQFGIRAG